MVKPILATNVDDLLIKHEAFMKPHESIWGKLIAKTGNKDLAKWIGKKDYFIGVNLAMDQIMPGATKEEKTLKVRTWYQEAVIDYIKLHPECVNEEVANRLRELKPKYKLILITSNAQTYIERILSSAKLEDIYEEIIASKTEQEPKKSDLIDEFFKKYGKPAYYLMGKEDSVIEDIFKDKKVKIITKKEISKL